MPQLFLAPPDEIAYAIETQLGTALLQRADAHLELVVTLLRDASHCTNPDIADEAVLARTYVAAGLRCLRGVE